MTNIVLEFRCAHAPKIFHVYFALDNIFYIFVYNSRCDPGREPDICTIFLGPSNDATKAGANDHWWSVTYQDDVDASIP